MSKNRAIISLLFVPFILCLQSTFVYGDTISVSELAEIMDDKNVRIVSARKSKDYGVVHLKNAINVWHKDLYKAGDIKGLIKSPTELANIFGSKGISETNTIVVYDGGKNKLSGRLYWIFDYLGCDDVRILNGQLKKWRKGRKPVTKEVKSFSSATFNASPDKNEICTMKYLKTHLDDANVVIVDVRDAEEYAGKKGEIERKGHIPGAIHFEYKKVLTEKGILKSKAELKKIVESAGITSDKEVILYCETSVRAGIVYIALKSILEYSKVRIYDGAYYEWSADVSNSVK